MHLFPPRHWGAMKLFWSCCCQTSLTPQIGNGAACAPVVSRWQPIESGRQITQSSNGKQQHLGCSKAPSSIWSACSPLLRHQGSSCAHLTAHPKSVAEFKEQVQEQVSSDLGDTAFSRLGPVCTDRNHYTPKPISFASYTARNRKENTKQPRTLLLDLCPCDLTQDRNLK